MEFQSCMFATRVGIAWMLWCVLNFHKGRTSLHQAPYRNTIPSPLRPLPPKSPTNS